MNHNLRAAQMNHVDTGKLQVQTTSIVGRVPLENAKITLSYTAEPGSTLEELRTDSNGQTEQVSIAAPPLEYSMEPDQPQPYAEYTIHVEAEGYRPVNVDGMDIFSGQLALQEVKMEPLEVSEEELKNIVIPAHTLFGDYPPKIAEDEIKPVDESGEIVLSRVVVPEYVVVHDGTPGDSTASDYYVRYKDYIKNVASSEIYATWPVSTITANILAIMSFTLNRVYTEWYRNQHSFVVMNS